MSAWTKHIHSGMHACNNLSHRLPPLQFRGLLHQISHTWPPETLVQMHFFPLYLLILNAVVLEILLRWAWLRVFPKLTTCSMPLQSAKHWKCIVISQGGTAYLSTSDACSNVKRQEIFWVSKHSIGLPSNLHARRLGCALVPQSSSFLGAWVHWRLRG